LFAAISFIKVIVSCESRGFLECAFDLRFGEHTEELTMPAKQRLWLDKEERLFPGSDYPGQKHQEKPIPFPVDRSFDVATKDDQLLS
jgi:hypothetical protein